MIENHTNDLWRNKILTGRDLLARRNFLELLHKSVSFSNSTHSQVREFQRIEAYYRLESELPFFELPIDDDVV